MTSSTPFPTSAPPSTTSPPSATRTSSPSTAPALSPEEIEDYVRSLLDVATSKPSVNPEVCRALLTVAQENDLDPQALWEDQQQTRDPSLGELPSYEEVAPSGAPSALGEESPLG